MPENMNMPLIENMDRLMKTTFKESGIKTPENRIPPVDIDCAKGDICYSCHTVIKGKTAVAGDRFFCQSCADDPDKGWELFDALRRDYDNFLMALGDDVRAKMREALQ